MKRKPPSAGGRALLEFLSEAQEIVETLGRNLLLIDRSSGAEPDPDLVNALFRGMHTMKSLAGMFGVESLARLAHTEESLLDDVRLGKRAVTPDLLDLLFESVEAMTGALAAVRDAGAAEAAGTVDIDGLIRRIEGSHSETEKREKTAESLAPADFLGPEVLEVLTEYEEHRLKTALSRGLPLFRVRARFSLQAIDAELETMKGRLKPVGEIITYLPSMEGSDPDRLEIDIILALRAEPSELAEILRDGSAEIERIEPRPRDATRRTTGPPKEDTTAPPARPETSLAPAPADGALAPRAEADQALSLRSVSQTVRVDIRKLDRLMNVVGELAIVRGAIARLSDDIKIAIGRRDLAIELHRINRGFDRRLFELREGILEVRMVSLAQMFDRLARLARKISRDLGKEIRFVVSGADTEVDKLIIEELSDPLVHIIRNSIGHGIESPADRRAAGKPDEGTVALTAYQKGNHVVIEVEDDGAGIDGKRLLEAAVRRGIVEAAQAEAMSEREILNLVFVPGVSTASEATDISGRGVGMDVVKTNIGALGGVVEIQSEPGTGTKITITLPVTLAIIPALLVLVEGRTYAIPLNTVAEALDVSPGDVQIVMDLETIPLRGRTLPLCRLDAFFGTPRPGPIPAGSCVVVASVGQRRLGLVVDALVGQQDVVIKPLGETLADVRCFSGATDIGDQRLALVLDTAAITEEFFSPVERSERRSAAE